VRFENVPYLMLELPAFATIATGEGNQQDEGGTNKLRRMDYD
jgi:hypothetical protein